MPRFPMGTGVDAETDGPSKQAESENTSHPVVTKVKNRRKRYLDLHPEYFSADLELAGPLALSSFLYD